MTGRLEHIFRHPVKGIGSEALGAAALSPAGALDGDRRWALLNAAAPDTDAWQSRGSFLQVASGPGLAGVRARSEGDVVLLSHPERSTFRLTGPGDGPALGAWLAGLWPADRPAPARLVRAPGHGMTDMPDPFVSLGNLSSLRAVSQRAGRDLDPRRFRINLWVEGLAPWEEFDLLDTAVILGETGLEGAERIGRCRATEADPETGRRDVNVRRVLEDGWGHTDFGIYLRVTRGGTVRIGDTLGAG